METKFSFAAVSVLFSIGVAFFSWMAGYLATGHSDSTPEICAAFCGIAALFAIIQTTIIIDAAPLDKPSEKDTDESSKEE